MQRKVERPDLDGAKAIRYQGTETQVLSPDQSGYFAWLLANQSDVEFFGGT